MSDLTTLANVKAWLAITQNGDDALIARLVTSYSAYIQQWMNRTIASQSYTEKRNGHGGYALALVNYPVTAVSSLLIDNNAIPLAANSTQSGYMFDDKFIYLNGYRFTPGRQNVQVAYTAGYAQTPPELEQAVIELIALRYKERDRIGHSSKAIGGETVSFIIKDLPDSVRTILENYKKVVPV
jgi:hypothetical protein